MNFVQNVNSKEIISGIVLAREIQRKCGILIIWNEIRVDRVIEAGSVMEDASCSKTNMSEYNVDVEHYIYIHTKKC